MDNLFVTLSAVLHLGNIEFEPSGNNDAAKITNPRLVRKGMKIKTGYYNSYKDIRASRINILSEKILKYQE